MKNQKKRILNNSLGNGAKCFKGMVNNKSQNLKMFTIMLNLELNLQILINSKMMD